MKQLLDYINEAAKKTKVPNGAITTTIKKAGVSNDIYRQVYDKLFKFVEEMGLYNILAQSWSVGPGHQYWRVGTKKTISALKKKYYGISFIEIEDAVDVDKVISTLNQWIKPSPVPFSSWEEYKSQWPEGNIDAYVTPSTPLSLGDGVQFLGYSMSGSCDIENNHNLNVTDKKIHLYLYTSHEDVE